MATENAKALAVHRGILYMLCRSTFSIPLIATLMGCCAPLLAAAPAAPGAPAPPKAVVLRYKFVPGDVQRYRMTMDMHMTMTGSTLATGTFPLPPMEMHTETVMARTVEAVNPVNGNATVGIHVESVTGDVNGKPVPQTPSTGATDQTVTITPSGKMTMETMPDGAGGRAGSSNMSGLREMNRLMAIGVFPEGPIGIGRSWSATGSMGDGTKLTSTMKLHSVSNENGHQIAKLGFRQKGKMSFSYGGNAPASQHAFSMSMSSLIAAYGSQNFDIDAGALRAVTTILTMDMGMKMKMNSLSGRPIPPFKAHIVERMDMTRLGDTESGSG